MKQRFQNIGEHRQRDYGYIVPPPGCCSGIEQIKGLDFLRDAGCDYAQGYFISKPLTAQDLAAMLAEGTKTPAEPAFIK